MHASLCDQLADLVQNSLEAGASRVVLRIDETAARIEVTVRDDGCGMDQAMQARVLNPFVTDGKKHPGRRVGLGLAFLKQMVEATGGGLVVESEEGHGTTLRFWLDPRHVDMPPLGDFSSTVVGLMTFPGNYELDVERWCRGQGYRIGRRALIDALGELETATSLALANDYVASQEEAVTMRKG